MRVKAVMTVVGYFNITSKNRANKDGSLMSEAEVLQTLTYQIQAEPGRFIGLHHAGMNVEVTRG